MTKLELNTIRSRMKRFDYRATRDAVLDINRLMDELDATRAMLARVCAKCPREMGEANEARRMMDL